MRDALRSKRPALRGRARGRPLPGCGADHGTPQVPTIGIGAGPDVDGQVLVWHDLLGLYDGHAPRFVKRYAELATEIQRAVEAYVGDVRDCCFPEEVHTYGMPAEELAAFEAELAMRMSGFSRTHGCPARRNPGAPQRDGGHDRDHRDDHGRERQRARDAPPRQLERRPQAEREQAERPDANASPSERTITRPTPSSAPPVLNQSGPNPSTIAGTVTRIERANGSAANATTCLAVRARVSTPTPRAPSQTTSPSRK